MNMKYDPLKHHRRSIRLNGYDYSQPGSYFITICAQNRECLFGDISDKKTVLNDIGQMVELVWKKMPERFYNTKLDEYIIMPNHLHGIIVIQKVDLILNIEMPNDNYQVDVELQKCIPTIGDIIGSFKSLSAMEYIRGVQKSGWKSFDKHLWQRNYYEHIIRNKNEFEKIRYYIRGNPSQWENDEENPDFHNPDQR